VSDFARSVRLLTPTLITTTLACVLCACPDQTPVERGLQLVYRKPEGADSIRAVVDRRLAQLKLRASLREDDRTLTVLVPESVNPKRIKALLARSGKLEFCPEDEVLATGWCGRAWPTGVELDRGPRTCGIKAESRQVLDDALGDGGLPVAFGAEGKRAAAWVTYPAGCISPRVVTADVHDGSGAPLSLVLEFDRAGARDFGALTQKAIGTRLLISLEGTVQASPIVMNAITGGRATLSVDDASQDVRLLAAVLVGGPLPELTLEKEAPYGPPSLR
jgi:preprotein translocase subunit SecD